MKTALISAGHFEGYASTFNHVDRGNDLVLPGAFERSLRERGAQSIKLLWQHDPREPIGVIEDIFEDHHGLYVRGRLLLDIGRAGEARKLMQAGAVDGLSIGFHTLKSNKRADGVRLLRDVDLWEISLVTFPMNPRARIIFHKEMAVDETALIAGLRHLNTLMTPQI